MRDNTLRTAPFFPRLAAWLLDRLILGILLFVPRMAAAFGKMGSEPLSRAFLFRYSVEDIVFWALCAAYFVIMTAVSGATLGKKAMGLKVVTPEGEKPSFLTVLSRETWARYLSSLLYIGYILCLADPENGTLHDRICDTRVVYAPPKERRAHRAPARAAEPAAPVPALTDGGDWYAPNR